MAEVDFDLLEPEQRASFEPLPPGWYPAYVRETEELTSAAGNQYLKVEFECTGADHSGRRVWENINWKHSTPSTAQTGQRIFSDLARACGLASCKDSEELHGLHLDILVKVEAGTNGYSDKNKTSAFRTAAAPAPVQAAASNGNAASLDDPLW